MKRKRIAILFVNKVSPKLGGGAELRMREIGKRLAKKGYEIYVVCGKTEPNLPDYEEIDGIKVYYVKTIPEFLFRFRKISFYLSRYLFYFLSVFRIYTLLDKVDVIVDNISPAPSFAYLLGKIRKKTVYAEIHEFFGYEWFKLKDPITAFFGFLSQYLLKIFKFDKIITVSKFTKRRLVMFGLDPQKIIVIPNGVDILKYSKCKVNNAHQNDSIVSIGRLVKQKGYEYLIEAMKKVIREVPNVRLYIVGDGPLKNKLVAKVRKEGLDRNIVLLGKVSDEEKLRVLNTSEIFVLPSLQEGFGITLLEAMACGLPIIANDLLVFREFINQQNGYLVDVRDTKRFAEAIVSLLKDEDKKMEMRKYNKRRAKLFNWDKIAEVVEKVYLGEEEKSSMRVKNNSRVNNNS